MDLRKYNQLAKEVKELREKAALLEVIQKQLAESVDANKELLAANTALTAEVKELRNQLKDARQKQQKTNTENPEPVGDEVGEINKWLKNANVLLVSGQQQFNLQAAKTFPGLKIEGSGFRNAKAEKIRSLDLVIVAIDNINHADSLKAKNLAGNYGISYREMRSSSISGLTVILGEESRRK